MRRGATILEVLFAILIFAIGVLGAVAIFPVAASYARKGQIADSVSVNGTSAFHQFDTRGMRRPDRWVTWIPARNRWENYGPFVGESYCIDPRFVARNSAQPVAASIFPYVPKGNVMDPRMGRLTLASGNFAPPVGNPPVQHPIPFGTLAADSIFTFSDDLAFTKPEDDRTLGAEQVWYEDVGGNPLVRETLGEHSWLATLVPVMNLDAIEPTDLYVLSVVMFHQRSMTDLGTDQVGDDLYDLPERVVDVSFPAGSDGAGGGTVLLTAPLEKLIDVQPGDWLCLAQNTETPRPIGATHPLAFQWYRVSDSEAPNDDDGDGTWENYVSLIGRDWNTSPTMTFRIPNATVPPFTVALPLVNKAFVLEGVKGVYEKTIRLEYGSAM